MPLRVLTVMAGAPYGGFETFFVTLSTALRRAGVAVHAVLRPNAIRETALKEGDVALDTLPFHRWLDMRTRKRLAQIAKRFRPDVVLTFAGRASTMMPKGDYPLIARLGGYYKLHYFRNCDYLVCITPDIVRHAVEGGWAKDKVFYIPNFPVVQSLPPLDRGLFGTPKDAPLAIALARLHPSKALDVLLRAVAKVPGLWLWIAGEGPEGAALKKMANELGIEDRVRFLGWRTDRSALLRAADVCVFPSRWEPNGTVVVEAWAHDIPLVTTDSAGPKWIARNGEDALIAPVDDVDALADRMRQVLQSKELAQKLVANGRRRVEQEFTEAAVIRKYIDMFEKVRAK